MSKGSNPFDYCDGFYVHVQNRSVTSNWLRCERGMQCCHLSARFFFISFHFTALLHSCSPFVFLPQCAARVTCVLTGNSTGYLTNVYSLNYV